MSRVATTPQPTPRVERAPGKPSRAWKVIVDATPVISRLIYPRNKIDRRRDINTNTTMHDIGRTRP